MGGNRKLWMCLALVAAVTAWVMTDLIANAGANLGGLVPLVASLGLGVFGPVWGNVQEHRAKTATATNAPGNPGA